MNYIMINYNLILEKSIQLHYMDTDSFVISINEKDTIKHLQKLEDFFDFSILSENHKLFSKKSDCNI